MQAGQPLTHKKPSPNVLKWATDLLEKSAHLDGFARKSVNDTSESTHHWSDGCFNRRKFAGWQGLPVRYRRSWSVLEVDPIECVLLPAGLPGVRLLPSFSSLFIIPRGGVSASWMRPCADCCRAQVTTLSGGRCCGASSPATRQQWSAAGRRHVEERFRIADAAAALNALYRELLDGGEAGP